MTTLKKAAVFGSALALSLAMAAPAFANENENARPEGFKDSPKTSLTINHQGKVVINGAEVTAVGANSLTVKLFGLTGTVNISADTKMVRRYGGASSLAEFMVGDRVMVRGTLLEGQTVVNATHVRNDSTREAAFRGTIATLTAPDMLTVTTGDNMVRTVKTTAATKIMVGNAEKTFADLAVGMKVSIKGMLNRLSEVVTAQKIMARVVETH